MAKVSVRIESSYTINIGNYESVRPSVGLEITLDEGEEFPTERISELFDQTRKYVDIETKKSLEKVGKIIADRQG